MEKKKGNDKEYAFKRPHEGHNDANFDLLAKSQLLTGENSVNAITDSTEKEIEASTENANNIIDKFTSNYNSNTALLIDALTTSLDALNKTLEDGIDVKDDIKKIEDDITVLQEKVQSNTDLIDSLSSGKARYRISANSLSNLMSQLESANFGSTEMFFLYLTTAGANDVLGVNSSCKGFAVNMGNDRYDCLFFGGSNGCALIITAQINNGSVIYEYQFTGAQITI